MRDQAHHDCDQPTRWSPELRHSYRDNVNLHLHGAAHGPEVISISLGPLSLSKDVASQSRCWLQSGVARFLAMTRRWADSDRWVPQSETNNQKHTLHTTTEFMCSVSQSSLSLAAFYLYLCLSLCAFLLRWNGAGDGLSSSRGVKLLRGTAFTTKSDKVTK